MGTEPDFKHGEPAPIPNEGVSMHDLVKERIGLQRFMSEQHLLNEVTPIHSLEVCDAAAVEIQKRKEFGLKKYGTLLQDHNGRSPLNDLIEELGDALVYSQQACIEAVEDPFDRGKKIDVFNRLLEIYFELMEIKLATDFVAKVLELEP